MPLIHDTYGKAGVRVMRVARGARHEVRELAVEIMLEGGFAAAFTAADNGAVVATDTLKNLAYVVARENLGAEAEPYGQALARAVLDRYPQVGTATVTSPHAGSATAARSTPGTGSRGVPRARTSPAATCRCSSWGRRSSASQAR